MKSNQFRDFFGFRKMISLGLLKFIYVLGVIGLIVWGINLMMEGTTVSIIAGLLTIIFGNLLWRICCELWTLFFSLHDLVKRAEKYLKNLSDSIKG